METYELLLTAAALSADAVAVSVSSGFSAKQIKTGNALLMAGFFGFFQAAMPLAGYYILPLLSLAFGEAALRFIEIFNRWAAFSLLAFAGGKMIFEACCGSGENKENPFALGTLFMMAAATGIDALAAGLVFRSVCLCGAEVISAASVIGLTAFLLSFAGVMLGKKMGKALGERFGRHAVAAGGIILIGLGIKLLTERLIKY